MPFAGILHGDHARQLDDAGLGRGIADLRRAGPAQAGRRCDIDDRAAFLALHDRQHVLQGEEDAFQVGIDLRIPDIFTQFNGSAMRRAADIVDQYVDAAETIETGFHHDFDRCGAGDVALMRDDLAACFFHALDGLRHAVEIAVDGEYPGAFLGEAHGGSASVAPAGPDTAGAGDDRDAVLQASAHDAAPVKRRAGAK